MMDAVEKCHVSGDGEYTQKCSELLENELGAAKVLLTTSGTHALELAALLLEPMSAVMSTFTFSSTANAFMLQGIQLYLVDIDPLTLNMDVHDTNELACRGDVVVPMHYAGVGCSMDLLNNKSYIIEDNAHGLFGKYKDKYLGTFGSMAALSFHETKNFCMGEGGALIINDPQYIEKAEIIREKGTNRTQFKRGMADKYTWMEIGSSYLPSDILAAHLYGQLEHWQSVQIIRGFLWTSYYHELQDWSKNNGVKLPYVPLYCKQSYHMFYLIMPDKDTRDRFINEMAQQGIMTAFHYVPLHLSPMGERLGYVRGDFPVAERVSDCLVRLPFYTDLSFEDQEYVIEKIMEFKI
jgi:dTDP-4-amino-4,6-dideoxygalactose transaminase